MTFRGDAQKTSSRARRTGGMKKGGIAVGGGGLGVVLLIGAYLLLGGDPDDLEPLLDAQHTETAEQNPHQQLPANKDDTCRTGADANKKADCRIEFTAISLDAVWEKQLPAQAGITYTKPGLTIFQGATQSGCGIAQSATGPFYCPTDHTAYFDAGFFEQLESLGGKNAPLAQEYVVAHEFGHHIQKLEGTLSLSNYNQPGADPMALKIELQADCYAGIWAHYADKGPDALLEPITRDQLHDAVAAARAVGDDNIQQRTQKTVNPDGFTHGSSAQREEAFLAGYTSGRLRSCDFLGRGGYRDS